jgi:hypothetical protein
VWEWFPQADAAARGPDPLLDGLGPGWERARDEVIPVRYHWNWSNLYAYRRSEYVRGP